MKTRHILIWFLLIGVVLTSGCKKDFDDLPLEEKLAHRVDSIRVAVSEIIGSNIPSLNLLVETSTERYFICSKKENEPEINADSWFRFASNTKTFTAAAIMNMHEDGWLNYGDKITQNIPGSTTPYVPAIPEWDIPFKNQISIAMLLNHSAGVFDIDNNSLPQWADTSYTHFKMGTNRNHQFSTNELIWEVSRNDLSFFVPGDGQQYSNTGYTILSEIVARVYSEQAGAAKTYADYLRDYIHGTTAPVPLDLHFPDQAIDQQLPTPYVTSSYIKPNGDLQYFDEENMSAHVGEGNGYGTLDMLNTWIRTLKKGENVLDRATIEMMENGTSADNDRYGLGTDFIPNLGWGHTGAIRGYFSIMYYDADHDVSVVGFVPHWDFSKGEQAGFAGLIAIMAAGWEVRELLGYPGRPF